MIVMEYAFVYGHFVLIVLMIASGLIALRSESFRRSRFYRLSLVLFVLAMLASVVYSPITITSPSNHSVVHPGERVKLSVEVRPAILTKLFPWVNLDLYRCHTCSDAPDGVVTEGALTGSPYTFYINLPKTLPPGEIYVYAYGASKMGGKSVYISNGVGLDVK